MENKLIGNEDNIVFYEDENNNTKVEVRLQDEDVWLNVNAIAKNYLNESESSKFKWISMYELREDKNYGRIAEKIVSDLALIRK